MSRRIIANATVGAATDAKNQRVVPAMKGGLGSRIGLT